jgi:hypothetical protein
MDHTLIVMGSRPLILVSDGDVIINSGGYGSAGGAGGAGGGVPQQPAGAA